MAVFARRPLFLKNVIRSHRKYTKLSYIHNPGSEPLKPLTIGQLLEETVKKHGDNEAVISRYQNQKITFRDALERADKMAAGFRNLGLNRGDRIGLWAPNLIEWYITKIASARAGLILVALNPSYQMQEIEYCINKVGIKSIVCPEKFRKQNYYEILNGIVPDIAHSEPGKLNSKKVPSLKSVITISDENLRGTFLYNEFLESQDESSINSIKKNQDSIETDDPCNIQFTSGTTGNPKAAVVSHFHLVNNGYFIGKRNELGQKHHKICMQVPFFHAFGTAISLVGALNFGATLVLPSPGYDPDKSLDSIRDEKCSIIYGTPTMYVDLIDRQKMRNEDINPEMAVTGGAPCSTHLFRQMLSVLKLRKVKSLFGLTEGTAVAFHSPWDDDEEKSLTTVGSVAEHLEVKVIDENGRKVPFGTPGELCVRGYSVMLGYWDDPEKTREMIGNDRWMKTGDQFVLEEDGFGKIVGRLKDMIIRGGENIYPKEIEDYLATHPSILECQVFGLPHNRLGEEVCVAIKLNDNGSNISLDELKEFCHGKIAHFKIPSRLFIVDEFPKTTSGKIQRYLLVKKFSSASGVNESK